MCPYKRPPRKAISPLEKMPPVPSHPAHPFEHSSTLESRWILLLIHNSMVSAFFLPPKRRLRTDVESSG